MTRFQWIVSAFIVFHVVALATASIPSPTKLLEVSSEPRAVAEDPVARVLTPAVDRAAFAVSQIEPLFYRALAPVRSVTRPYLSAGVGDQQWRMFSNPFEVDKYARIDWYVTDGVKTRLLRQVVLPADPEQDIRFRHEFRDKAIMAALERHADGVREARTRGPVKLDEIPDARRLLKPITQHFRYKLGQALGSNERVAVTELWYGEAAIAPRGKTLPPNAVAERLARLRPYQRGAAEVSSVLGYRSSGTTEREGDLRWLLLYSDRP